MLDPEAGFLRLLAGLDRLEIPCMVTGSAASSSYGIWRATNDVDLVEAPQVDQIERTLEPDRDFNQFDLFPLTADAYQQRQFSRRRYAHSAVFGSSEIEFAVASPEDVILSKLAWYRAGGEVSEQQWNDVLGIIAQRGAKLDFLYLHDAAPLAGVADLLERALAERHGE